MNLVLLGTAATYLLTLLWVGKKGNTYVTTKPDYFYGNNVPRQAFTSPKNWAYYHRRFFKYCYSYCWWQIVVIPLAFVIPISHHLDSRLGQVASLFAGFMIPSFVFAIQFFKIRSAATTDLIKFIENNESST